MDLSAGDFLKTREVCQLLRISKQSLYAAVYEGRLPVMKVTPRSWRFRKDDVLNLFRSEPHELPKRARIGGGRVVLDRVPGGVSHHVRRLAHSPSGR